MSNEPTVMPETDVSPYCAKCAAELWPDEHVCPMCAEVRTFLPERDPSAPATQNYRFGRRNQVAPVSIWRRFLGNGWVLFTSGFLVGAVCATVVPLLVVLVNHEPDRKKVIIATASPSATVISTMTPAPSPTATPNPNGHPDPHSPNPDSRDVVTGNRDHWVKNRLGFRGE